MEYWSIGVLEYWSIGLRYRIGHFTAKVPKSLARQSRNQSRTLSFHHEVIHELYARPQKMKIGDRCGNEGAVPQRRDR
jgi:hypothetical protein